jgi:hypothetical protein
LAAASAIYIERALINPSGPDAGREVVVLANLATTAQTLTDWRLVDKNARVTAINATIGPGQSILLTLDGSGVQLGNQPAHLSFPGVTQGNIQGSFNAALLVKIGRAGSHNNHLDHKFFDNLRLRARSFAATGYCRATARRKGS